MEGFEPLRMALEKKRNKTGEVRPQSEATPKYPVQGQQQRILDNPFEEASPEVHPEKWREANEQHEHK